MVFLQLHHIPQHTQAVRSLLQQIAHQNKHVVWRKAQLFQQALEVEQIAVNVADGNDPAARFNAGPDYAGRLVHGFHILCIITSCCALCAEHIHIVSQSGRDEK